MTFPSFCWSGCGLAFPKLRALGAITAEVLPWQNPSQPIFGARRRKGGSGALRCELDMDRRGFQIRLGDAIYSMQYAVYIYIYVYITILYDIYIIYIYIQWYCICCWQMLISVKNCQDYVEVCVTIYIYRLLWFNAFSCRLLRLTVSNTDLSDWSRNRLS